MLARLVAPVSKEVAGRLWQVLCALNTLAHLSPDARTRFGWTVPRRTWKQRIDMASTTLGVVREESTVAI
ncbi:hypothetical protein LP52_18045 [Streptomonospora alba]|uniref:Uncharacterized protein n=1 Tax=Streptomonospora alba TaxID=183763 RepID=A0A0C2J816_9ACTN|nr:hypothetical protein LP52_18045 [Streptomonospora alba]